MTDWNDYEYQTPALDDTLLRLRANLEDLLCSCLILDPHSVLLATPNYEPKISHDAKRFWNAVNQQRQKILLSNDPWQYTERIVTAQRVGLRFGVVPAELYGSKTVIGLVLDLLKELRACEVVGSGVQTIQASPRFQRILERAYGH